MSTAAPSLSPLTLRLASKIARLFGSDRLILGREFDLHDELAKRLAAAQIPFAREVRKGLHKRPDFMVRDVAVELKVGGAQLEILRQIKRYTDDPSVGGVVLVTTRPVDLPATLSRKPVASVSLWRNLL